VKPTEARPRAEARGVSPPGSAAGHRYANRVVDILELLARSTDGLALREVSAELEAPESSLLPLLRALTARGYLERARTGDYRLGARLRNLGGRARAERRQARIAQKTRRHPRERFARPRRCRRDELLDELREIAHDVALDASPHEPPSLPDEPVRCLRFLPVHRLRPSA